MKINISLILLTFSFLACQNEPAEQDSAETTTATETIASSQAMGKFGYIKGDTLVLDNSQSIGLPVIGDTAFTTIFLVRHGETMEGKTSLDQMGQARSTALANMFSEKQISQAYAEGNASMQTALNVTKENEGCGLNFINFDGTDSLVKNMMGEYKGRRVVAAATAETLAVLLNQFAGETKYTIPPTEFDNMYVVLAKGVGKAEIFHVKY